MLERNYWNHTTVCKLFLFDWKTYHVYETILRNNYRKKGNINLQEI